MFEHFFKGGGFYASIFCGAVGQGGAESFAEFIVRAVEASFGVYLSHKVYATLADFDEFPKCAFPAGGVSKQVFQFSVFEEVAGSPAEHAEAECIKEAVVIL